MKSNLNEDNDDLKMNDNNNNDDDENEYKENHSSFNQKTIVIGLVMMMINQY